MLCILKNKKYIQLLFQNITQIEKNQVEEEYYIYLQKIYKACARKIPIITIRL